MMCVDSPSSEGELFYVGYIGLLTLVLGHDTIVL